MFGSRVVFHGRCSALQSRGRSGLSANFGQAASVIAGRGRGAFWVRVGCC
ncbi:hypothetical protein [Pseudomonas sp. CMR5c]|nr:hypothetical protein [Pseudomonas sp. CMR5c]